MSALEKDEVRKEAIVISGKKSEDFNYICSNIIEKWTN
jgi:hypothetical protein